MKRQKQKENTREQLMHAAYQMFGQQGFLATKTVDVAKAAGVSHGTFFVHFATREDLLLKAVEQFGMKMGQLMQGLDKCSGINEVLAKHLEILKQEEPFYIQLLKENASLPKGVRSHLFFIQSGMAVYLNKALQRELKQIKNLPFSFIFNTWIALVNYYLTNRDLFAPNQSVIEVKGQEIIDNFITLIFKEDN